MRALAVLVLVQESCATPRDLGLSCEKPTGFPTVLNDNLAPHAFSTVCTTPSSVRLLMDARGVTDGDQIIMDIISEGPVPWSVSRFNQGDAAPLLGPRWPASQPNLGVRAPSGGSSFDYVTAHCSQAWSPDRKYGIILPTVARNGQDWGDGQFYGTVATATGTQGYGYSMADGSFGQGSLDVIVGKAGEQKEGNIDFAISWMPYFSGFPSGYVAAPVYGQPAQWQEPGSHSPLLPDEAQEVVHWRWGEQLASGGNHSMVRIPGYRAEDGMLFATATDKGLKNNDLNTVGVRPSSDGSGWMLQIHEDFDPFRFDISHMSEWVFAFLFVPFTGVKHLHAAFVNGITGTPYRVAGGMSVLRLDTGRYLIRVNRKDERDGILVLQCASHHGSVPGTSSAFLSYEWDKTAAGFVVEARHVHTALRLNHPERFPRTDVDFYVMWMDHRLPLSMPSMEEDVGKRTMEIAEAEAQVNAGYFQGFMAGGSVGTLVMLGMMKLMQAVLGWRRHWDSEARSPPIMIE